MTDVVAQQPSAPAVRRGPPLERHLVIVHQPHWQSLDDWRAIAVRARNVDPTTGIIVVGADRENGRMRERAAQLPSLIFSPGPLGRFKPLRGRVYQGRQIRKFEQLQRLAAAGLPVPRTQLLQPGIRLDPKVWGEYTIVKPTDIPTSSKGAGIQLMRTERVRYVAPQDYPANHPGRFGPMMAQQFIDTGDRISAYRVLTLFGEPLYCQLSQAQEQRVDLGADDKVLEGGTIAIQGVEENRLRIFKYEADVVALARAAHRAVPEIPLKGVDILRDSSTGRLYLLELNPGGNTWHFSSRFLAEARAKAGPEHERQRLSQLDAFGTAAHVLMGVTRREAE